MVALTFVVEDGDEGSAVLWTTIPVKMLVELHWGDPMMIVHEVVTLGYKTLLIEYGEGLVMLDTVEARGRARRIGHVHVAVCCPLSLMTLCRRVGRLSIEGGFEGLLCV